VQPNRCGAGVPPISGDPREACVGRAVAGNGAHAATASHAGEPRGRARGGVWSEPATHPRADRTIGSASGRAVYRPEASSRCGARSFGTDSDEPNRGLGTSAVDPDITADAAADHRADLAGALSRPVHGGQGHVREAATPSGAASPRNPERRSGRHLRSRRHAAPREGGEREKIGAAKKPRAIRPGTDKSRSRHTPNEAKRVAWRRDGGQCGFVAPNGQRCTELAFIEFHHVQAYALGGPSTPDNIGLRCRRHNQYEAERVFGPRQSQ